MKKIIVVLLSILCIYAFASTVVCVFSDSAESVGTYNLYRLMGHHDNTQTRTAKACAVEVNGNNVLMETADGNLWELHRRYGIEQGKKYILAFDTCGTADILDDAIIGIY